MTDTDWPPLATCSYTEYRTEMGIPVRFTVGAPRWRLPYTLAGVARLCTPTRAMLSLPKDAYALAYRRHLAAAEGSGRGLDAIAAELVRLAVDAHLEDRPEGEQRLVLLCFERLNETAKGGGENWCHRSMFAAWWTEQTGQEVPELGAHFVPRTDVSMLPWPAS